MAAVHPNDSYWSEPRGPSSVGALVMDAPTDRDTFKEVSDLMADFIGGEPKPVDGVTAAGLLELPDGEVNGFVVKVAGASAGYGQGQAFMVLEEGAGDATDQTSAGKVLFRVDEKGSIGTSGGLHIAPGLRKPYGGTQAVWIQPSEDVMHLVMTATPAPTKPFIVATKNDATNLFLFDKDGGLALYRSGINVGWFSAENPLFGVRLGVNAGAPDVIPFLIGAVAGQTADLMRVGLGATTYAKFNKSGYFIIRKTAAPPDADLSAGDLTFWLDASDALPRLVIRAKSNNGTVKIGAVALS